VIRTQFSDGSGNLYKPEGTGASFQAGTFDKATFSKETNEDEANYSDILALFAALHDTSRTTDPAAWRAKLEAVLNVDGFVHWLAVNTVIQNWDVYGTMAHNYYLYNDPATGLLNWLPWDNNEALSSRSGRRGGNNGALNLAGVNNSWPLIRYVIDDPVYQKLYVRYVEDTVNGAFEPTKMETTFTTWHNLIRPYVVGDGDGQAADKAFTTAQAFDSSLTELINHAKARYKAAQDYIAQQ
jgi:spore coat protein CotH